MELHVPVIKMENSSFKLRTEIMSTDSLSKDAFSFSFVFSTFTQYVSPLLVH